MTVDDVLRQIRARLDLEAETEHEVLEEIRCHLGEAVDEARAGGLDEVAALAQVAARFGLDDVAAEIQATHTGWGTLEGVAAAALPVLLALVLRWVVFNPDGTVVGWHEMLARPALWAAAAIALLVPLRWFPRRRYALIGWVIFWSLSVLVIAARAVHW